MVIIKVPLWAEVKRPFASCGDGVIGWRSPGYATQMPPLPLGGKGGIVIIVLDNDSERRKSQLKVFGAAFFKKLLGMQGARPLHSNCFVLKFIDFILFLIQSCGNSNPESACPMAQSQGQVNPETSRTFFDKLNHCSKQ